MTSDHRKSDPFTLRAGKGGEKKRLRAWESKGGRRADVPRQLIACLSVGRTKKGRKSHRSEMERRTAYLKRGRRQAGIGNPDGRKKRFSGQSEEERAERFQILLSLTSASRTRERKKDLPPFRLSKYNAKGERRERALIIRRPSKEKRKRVSLQRLDVLGKREGRSRNSCAKGKETRRACVSFDFMEEITMLLLLF